MKTDIIAIVGFGVTGKSSADYFSKIGAKNIHVFDNQPEIKFDSALIASYKKNGIIFHFETNEAEDIKMFDLVMASPGCPLTVPIIRDALKNKIPVYNDVSYFINFWRQIGPTVGITGSNGKSTTVSLLHYVLNKIGRENILVGNIGNSPLPELLKKHSPGAIAIFELSSYQLELFQPENYADIAVIMNLTENHLDRYGGKIELYAEAKMRVANLEKTDLILVTDDAGTRKYILPKTSADRVTTISLSDLAEETLQFVDAKNRKLKGDHNLYNIAIVIEVLRKLGITIDKNVASAISEYAGLEHRIEFVRSLDGVNYINDSKCTSVDAMRVALEAIGEDKNIVLIAGGSDKEGSFSPLSDHFNKFVKFVVIMTGYDSTIKKIKSLAEKNNIEAVLAGSMADAVKLARGRATPGDTVLLSPGGGKVLHMKNFEVVGTTFKNEVNKLS